MYLDISTWEQTFQELIQLEEPKAKWTLKLDENIKPGCMARGWRQYLQKAFGRFWCSSCHRSWASAEVKILCHMYKERWTTQGQVLIRVFAQRCQKCTWSHFENPEFSSDSNTRILNNLAQCVLHNYYGHSFRKMSVVREVPLDGPHDRSNCEACTLGVCVKGSQRPIKKPSESPPSTPNSERIYVFYGNGPPDEVSTAPNPLDVFLMICFFLFFMVALIISFEKNKFLK